MMICYRCNLRFKKESTAELHKEITGHDYRIK